MINDEMEEKVAGEGERIAVTGRSRFAAPLMIATLVTALLLGPIVLVRLLAPQPAWRFLPPVVFLIALESVYTTRWLQHPDRRQLSGPLYRLAEIIVIATLLRLLTWALGGGVPGWEAWRTYYLSPLQFFDAAYTGYLAAGVIAWERSSTFGGLFDRLALSDAEIAFYSLPPKKQSERSEDRPIDRERPAVFANLARSWLHGGFVLAILAALTTVDLPSLAGSGTLRNIGRLGLQPEMLLALLVYFLLGLWMLSYGRLIMMQARWAADGVRAGKEMASKWLRSSLALILGAAFIAAFLPIGSTFAISLVLGAIVQLALVFMEFLFVLVALIPVFLLSLLGLAAPSGNEPAPAPVVAPTAAPAAGAPVDETTALILGAIFWFVVAAVAAVALIFFVRERGAPLGSASVRSWWRAFIAWLRTLWQCASGRAVALRRAVRVRLPVRQKEGEAGRLPWRFIRPGQLPPRERVRYFYLSVVRRAGEKGVARDKSETPAEYAGDLKREWPGAEGEIEALTGAFLEARYSRRDFDEEDVNPVKRAWKEVRATVRRRKQSSQQKAKGEE